MKPPAYRGRFAPSPTGPLHFGSIVTAIASHADARSHGGSWLLRIDDLDQTRCVDGMDARILRNLEDFGFEWDEPPVYQSQCTGAYQQALQQLARNGHTYACQCSRRQIRESARSGIEGPVYPDTCRELGLQDAPGLAVRLRTDDRPLSFSDRIFGTHIQHLHREIGDFVIRRADGYFAYQLAVVVDDKLAGITHVVRGEDLLNSTARQIYLQQLLGLASPVYLHVPLVYDDQGRKLSKRDRAHPVDEAHPLHTLLAAWDFLQQRPPDGEPDGVEEFWQWAIAHWDPRRLREQRETEA